MLRTLEMKNFKIFKTTGKIQTAPITLLSGQNSSGKSSLLQSILAIKQTIESPYTDEPLILNGAYVSLGEFEDILNCHAEEKETLDFGFKFDYENRNRSELEYENSKEIELEVNFDRPDTNVSGNAPILISSTIQVKYDNEIVKILMKRDKNIMNSMRKIYNIENKEVIDDRKVGYKLKSTKKFDEEVKVIFMNKFLPNYFLTPIQKELIDLRNTILKELIDKLVLYFKIDEKNGVFNKRSSKFKLRELLKRTEKMKSIVYDRNSNIEELLNKIFDDRSVVEQLMIIFSKMEADTLRNIKVYISKKSELINEALELKKTLMLEDVDEMGDLDIDEESIVSIDDINDIIIEFFKKVYYLGPLREEPKVFYSRSASTDPMYVGHKGENVAFILKYYAKKEISAILPSSINSDFKISEANIVKCSLEKAVIEWLKYIGVATTVKVEEMGKLGLSIHANIYGDKDVDLINVGVGVSQVLPLIVLGLASPEHSTLLIEQPELHLHPFAQSRLGDFFVCLSKLNKQVIAETHSEHLIHRMRYHVAKNIIDKNKDLSIYFSIREKESEEAKLLPILIDNDGAIDEWPEGFFDETQKQLNEILMANFAKYEM